MQKKYIRVTTTVIGGSGVKSSRSEIKAVNARSGHSRPMYALAGSRRCGGLPILKRTEKAYAAIAWRMAHEEVENV